MVSKWADGFPTRGDVGTTRLEPKRFCRGRQAGANLFAGNEFCEGAAEPANRALTLGVFGSFLVLLEALDALPLLSNFRTGRVGVTKGNRPADGASNINLAWRWQSSAHRRAGTRDPTGKGCK